VWSKPLKSNPEGHAEMQLRLRPAWHDRFVSLVALASGDGSPVFDSLSDGLASVGDLFLLTARGIKIPEK